MKENKLKILQSDSVEEENILNEIYRIKVFKAGKKYHISFTVLASQFGSIHTMTRIIEISEDCDTYDVEMAILEELADKPPHWCNAEIISWQEIV